jgi:mRNA interferase RelE/StbE
MAYSVSILRRAQKELGTLPQPDFARVTEAIRSLSESPRPRGCAKLVAREGWRIRVGRNRVVYEIDDDERTVLVLHVGHRRDVYE